MPASKDRFTAVVRVTHQRFNKQPKGVAFSFSRALGLDGEEGYLRDPRIGEDWVKLDLGWCGDQKIAYIVIANTCYEAKPPGHKTSPEEEAAEQDSCLELRYEDSKHCFYILPREVLPFYPSQADALLIRMRKGSSRYRIFVVPE